MVGAKATITCDIRMAPLLALLPLLASSASSPALRSMAEQIAELDQRAAAGLPACECLPSLCVRSRCRFRGQPVPALDYPRVPARDSS